jgi:osmotically-inducible protein OsmY
VRELRHTLAALAAVSLIAVASGCAAIRHHEPAGAYVDDAAITSSIQARMVEDKSLDAAAIQVETRNGNVTLSGFATDRVDKQAAEQISIKVKGVKTVQNNIAVRP